MAVKIRLRAQGSVNRIMYRVVVADSRSPRDGKYIEAVGWYNPLAKKEMQIELKPERLHYWLSQGAEATDKVLALMAKAAPQVLADFRAKKIASRKKAVAARKSLKKAKAKK